MALQFSIFGGSDLAKLSATEANIPNGQARQTFPNCRGVTPWAPRIGRKKGRPRSDAPTVWECTALVYVR